MLKDGGEKSAQKQQPMLLTGGMYHQYQRREEVLPNPTARPPRPPANQHHPKKARPPPAACSSSNSSSASTLPAQSPPALPSQPSSAGRPNVQQSMCRVWPQQQKVQDGGHHKADENSSAASDSSVTIVHTEEPREAEEFSGNSTAELGDHMPAGDGGLLFGPMQLARAHWIQLHKTGMQLPVLRRMFLQLLQQNAQLRALWPFARHFDGSATRLEQLVQAPAFRHFCQSYQAAITMLMDNLDDEPALSRLLQEMGSNHFFYDCIESHIKLMRDEFFRTLVDCLAGTSEELDGDLAEDWEKLWAKLQSNMGFGLKVQRHNYLAHCVTGQEMSAMRAQWSRLCEAITGIGQLAKNIGGTGAEAFLEGLTAIGLDGSRAEQRTLFIRASHELIRAMEKAVTLWEPGTGFLRVCAEIEDKCLAAGELIQRVGAPLVRRPFIEAFSGELAALDGQKGGDEQKQKDAVEATATLHSWTKLYRVAEQAIVASQLEAK